MGMAERPTKLLKSKCVGIFSPRDGEGQIY